MPEFVGHYEADQHEAPMIITCPKCETSFALADELYKPGKKARCSQCGNIFPMPQQNSASSDALPNKGFPATGEKSSGSKKSILFGIIGLLLLCGIGYGGFHIYKSLGAGQEAPGAEPLPPTASQPRRDSPSQEGYQTNASESSLQDRIDRITLSEVRQFVVDNEKLGRIVIIQGVAINTSPIPMGKIEVEGRLLGKNKQTLDVIKQMCGAPITLFQLQVLDFLEIEKVLSSPLDILTNNSEVGQGDRVPFVLVFPRLPENLESFSVRVVNTTEYVKPLSVAP